jgi:hypothetical protein
VIPDGQVELHMGVAVNGVELLVLTLGEVGLKDTEVRVLVVPPGQFAIRPVAFNVPQPDG